MAIEPKGTGTENRKQTRGNDTGIWAEHRPRNAILANFLLGKSQLGGGRPAGCLKTLLGGCTRVYRKQLQLS